MGVYLGLDLGGTTSRWAWSDSGEVQETPGGIQAAMGIERAAGALAQLLALIWSRFPERTPDLVAIGMAGAGDPEVAREIGARIGRSGLNWPLIVVGDVVVAAAAALAQGPGVALWSGTGSFAVARDDAGELHRIGGRGHLISDAGSAYDIVRRAGVAVVRALDGVGQRTELSVAMVKAFGCSSPVSLGRAMQHCSPAELAGRCPVVVECAEAGDQVAVKVLRGAALVLAMQARAAARRAGLDPAAAGLFLGGGVVEPDGLFKNVLAERLREAGFAQPPRTVPGGAARGSVVLAEAVHHKREPICRWVEHVGSA